MTIHTPTAIATEDHHRQVTEETNCVEKTETRPKKRQKPNGSARYHTATLPPPRWTYFHLQLFTSSSSTSKPTADEAALDAITVRRYLSAALSRFLGQTGAATPIDILKLDQQHVWIRVPSDDATAVHEAVSSWASSQGDMGDGTGLRWIIKGRDDWLPTSSAVTSVIEQYSNSTNVLVRQYQSYMVPLEVEDAASTTINSQISLIALPPTVDLGNLGILPTEIIQDICMHLDLRSMTNMRAVNRQMSNVVAGIPQYQAIANQSLTILKGLLAVETGKMVTCGMLYNKLKNEACETCDGYGSHLYALGFIIGFQQNKESPDLTSSAGGSSDVESAAVPRSTTCTHQIGVVLHHHCQQYRIWAPCRTKNLSYSSRALQDSDRINPLPLDAPNLASLAEQRSQSWFLFDPIRAVPLGFCRDDFRRLHEMRFSMKAPARWEIRKEKHLHNGDSE
ncbi:hypothetical protein EG327_004333 [Venturia inaequalis]|uniref:F-box domain-containing protein n=1 Tax=Venturia inaequalis TaxID=5025 RepID=A0A8H3VVI6_VENIN|nr:hypothetical protein EG327_004333 [Venturia inaequalis]